MKSWLRFISASLLCCSLAASADEAKIRQSLAEFMPNETVSNVLPTGIPGLFEVTVGGNILYVSEDGRYVIQGDLFDVQGKKNLTEGNLGAARKAAIDKIGEAKMIIFPAANPKYTITVFTDLDCGYCRKLHSEISQYLAQGITVRYMFYPRAGKGSDSYKKAISVWCAEDRPKALTNAKQGGTIESKTCDHPVDQHMALAESFGLNGTPMIITPKGTVLPGYVPAAQLAKVLARE
jgi:thiol:disulfide interchange protein DsbC